LISRMVEKEGRLGSKNSKGLYEYPPKPANKSIWPELKDFYPQKKADEVDVAVLKQRFLVTIALEAARTVEEGIVTDPREADVGSILGFGFAPYTGGALSYIDGMGVKAFVELAERLAGAYGDHFKPTPLLKDMAARGETFYGRFDPYAKMGAAA
ncbi:3-hydroxyacyl-CoA dehydrogenase, partial [Rhizobium phaseoli]